MSNANTKSSVEELTPATGEINIEELLNDIERFITQHAILPPGASDAVALWCLSAYNINCFRIFPKLTIHSAVKRCGKSTLLDLIEAFCPKAFITSNMTAATIFRLIDKSQPTLIIDEADTFVAGDNKDIVGIINGGHARNRAYVTRCVGETYEPKKFSTWSPMVLASIGELQPTIMDRSVVISIQRKAMHEKVKRIPVDLSDSAEPLRKELLKWSLDNSSTIKDSPIEPPDLGNSRAVDNWLPLFTIARLVSDDWYKRCENAYDLLNRNNSVPETSTILLEDIRDVFQKSNIEKISSSDLVSKLIDMLDHPWCEFKNGSPMSQNGLAGMLKPYGIKPKGIRLDGITPRGYELQQFTDAFDRYLT